jgi:uncharacterized membrane protein YfcA
VDAFGYGGLSLLAACLGAMGGLGGAILLVPALVLTGMTAAAAAPLGLLCVASGSLAAAPRQLLERTVNHRIGVVIELVASAGAVTGALLSGLVSEAVLTRGLAVVALAAAYVGVRRTGLRNPPNPDCTDADVGERVGSLSGAYRLGDAVAPYRTTHLPRGLGLMALSGFVAGTSGASGGFIKTPTLNELMHVPVRVAAATTTFTVGITSAAALLVFALQDRIDTTLAGPVIAGSLLGGLLGAKVQSRLPPLVIRRGLCALLVVVAAVLAVRS